MSTKSTFNASITAYNIMGGRMFTGFRTGTPTPSNGTLALSAYHSYVSLAWFNAQAIATAISGERVLNISFSATSAGSNEESAEPCVVRLYRTDLGYDPSKAGWTTADTLRLYDGLTYADPYNEHFLVYGETAEMARGGSLTQSVFLEGQQAQDLAESLADGNALGSWAIKSGSSFMKNEPPYRVRYLSNISVTIEHEPQTTDITPPDKASLDQPFTGVDGEVGLTFSGTIAPTVNPIAGYRVQYKESDDAGETYGAWQDGWEYDITEASGTVVVHGGGVNTVRKFRIQVIGTDHDSGWTEATGTLTVSAPPTIGTLLYELHGLRCDFQLTVPADPMCNYLYVLFGEDVVGMLPATGGICRFSRVIAYGRNDISVCVRDEFGGLSNAKERTIYASRTDYGKNWLSWRGRRSEDFMLMVEKFMYRTISAERADNDSVIGLSGDTAVTEGKQVRDAYDAQFVLIAMDSAVNDDICEWLTGEGELIFGDDPDCIYDARIVKSVTAKRYDGRHENLVYTIKAHVQPFHRKRNEENYMVSMRNVQLYNAGTVYSYPVIEVYGTGDLWVEIDGRRLSVFGVTDYCKIDTYDKAVVNLGGELLTATSGDYPILPAGTSRINYSEGITLLKVQMRQRWL